MLPRFWVLTDIPTVPRVVHGTYGFVHMDDLPWDLSGYDDDLPFLSMLDVTDPVCLKNVNELVEQAKRKDLKLSLLFTRFMSSTQAQQSIPSCTANYFDLDDTIHELPDGKGYCIRFLNDQQSCCFWYLRLLPNLETGEIKETVLWNIYGLGLDDEDREEGENDPMKMFMEGVIEVADSFDSFLRRYYIENELWFKLDFQQAPLTNLERRYLTHARVIPTLNYRVLIALLSVRDVPRIGDKSAAKILPVDILKLLPDYLPLTSQDTDVHAQISHNPGGTI